MKTIHIFLEQEEWEKHNKLKGDRSWKEYLMRD